MFRQRVLQGESGSGVSSDWGWGNTCNNWQVLRCAGFKHPVIVRKAEFIATSTSFVLVLLDHAGEQYSAVRYTRARLLVLSVLTEAPHPVPASRFNSAQRDKTFCRIDVRCGSRVSDRSKFTPRYVGFGSNSMVLPSTEMCSRRPTSSVLRWYEAYTVFSLLSWRRFWW